jgi:carboxymethylenebutenolidase
MDQAGHQRARSSRIGPERCITTKEIKLGQSITLTASDGKTIGAWRVDPPGPSRGGLIVCQEIFGVNSHIRSVCEGYAQAGYTVIAPAFFDRAEPGVELGYTADDIARGRALMGQVSIDTALLDVESARALLAPVGRVGIVGYCWGGTVAWAAATRIDGLACSAPFYGGGIAGLSGERPRCAVEMHFGETDHAIPMSDVERIKAAQPGVPVHVYPAGHGFSCDQRGSYHEASARLGRERVLALLAQHVG